MGAVLQNSAGSPATAAAVGGQNPVTEWLPNFCLDLAVTFHTPNERAQKANALLDQGIERGQVKKVLFLSSGNEVLSSTQQFNVMQYNTHQTVFFPPPLSFFKNNLSSKIVSSVQPLTCFWVCRAGP